MRSDQTVSKKTLVGSSPYASDCKLLVSRAGSDGRCNTALVI